jgi:N-acyl-D-aspartate/D-glutamate deacylase
MSYDLVIKNGVVIDGSGMPRYRGDVGVVGGRIAAVGRIRESAREVIDADGQVVAPGFVDGHTHMDAQVFWDPLGTCSCWHGVTSVVMGNCGFTLAPCAKSDRHLVVRNLERAEDIASEAMDAGIDWTWTTFPEFLTAVDGLPKGINYAGYVGHSALRTYAMGERAFDKAATEDDLRAMERELREALTAGAMGFTTSRSPSHETPDRRPVASRVATWDEVRRLVSVMGEMNAGIFEIAGERFNDPAGLRDYHVRLRDLAVTTGRPITWGLFSRREDPTLWRTYIALLEETARAGGRMFAQVHSRALTVVLSFKTNLPFDRLPVWKELRALPLEEQKRRLRDPELRSRLVAAARERDERRPIGAEARAASYDWIFVMDSPTGPYRSVADVARERACDPVEAMIDLALERDLDRFFLQPIANEDQDHALELIKHPRTAVTFSDSGAHVSQIMDASLQTHLLAHWVRDKQALTLEQAVRMLSFDNATHWGFADRGLIREGFAADLVVFDPATVGPEMPEVAQDLPAGARRLVQRSRGFAATVVNGETVLRDGKHTGALPGRLLRGPLARA